MRTVLLFITAIVLVGCGAAENLHGMYAKQQAVTADVDKALGVESQVGWNWRNGVLIDVTVVIPADQVNGATGAAELARLVESIVEKHFEKKPRVLYVALSVASE